MRKFTWLWIELGAIALNNTNDTKITVDYSIGQWIITLNILYEYLSVRDFTYIWRGNWLDIVKVVGCKRNSDAAFLQGYIGLTVLEIAAMLSIQS